MILILLVCLSRSLRSRIRADISCKSKAWLHFQPPYEAYLGPTRSSMENMYPLMVFPHNIRKSYEVRNTDNWSTCEDHGLWFLGKTHIYIHDAGRLWSAVGLHRFCNLVSSVARVWRGGRAVRIHLYERAGQNQPTPMGVLPIGL